MKLTSYRWIVINKSSGEWAVVPAPGDQMEKATNNRSKQHCKTVKSNKFKYPLNLGTGNL